MNTLNMDAHYARQVEEQQEEETMSQKELLDAYIAAKRAFKQAVRQCGADSPEAQAAREDYRKAERALSTPPVRKDAS